MDGKELKKLNRKELVDIIYQMKKNEQEMLEKIDSLQNELRDKRIRLTEAGSIAEAGMAITDVFDRAQQTADIYLNEIACMKEEAERECSAKIEEANRKVERVLADGNKQLDKLKSQYKIDYKKWKNLREEIKKMEKFKELAAGKDKKDGK